MTIASMAVTLMPIPQMITATIAHIASFVLSIRVMPITVSVIWDNYNPLVYRFRTSCAPISSSLSGLPLPSTAEFTTFLFEAIRE